VIEILEDPRAFAAAAEALLAPDRPEHRARHRAGARDGLPRAHRGQSERTISMALMCWPRTGCAVRYGLPPGACASRTVASRSASASGTWRSRRRPTCRTPPPLRGRGYASSAVAALARRLFGDGAEQVVLFTDLTNPTPNRIYGEIGFRRLAEYEEHALHR
jgi:hypothetical protein